MVICRGSNFAIFRKKICYFNLLPKSVAALRIEVLVNLSGGRNKRTSSGQQSFFGCGEVETAEYDYFFFQFVGRGCFCPRHSLISSQVSERNSCIWCPVITLVCLGVCGSVYHLVGCQNVWGNIPDD